MSLDREKITSLISNGGIFSKTHKGFESRPSQIAMMNDVMDCYEKRKVALIEAGTGIGKSVAYLIPALFWALEKSEKTVVSTNTIALQEQLIQKDIPFILKTLDLPIKAVLVKGMHNYVCIRKLQDLDAEARFLNADERDELDKIHEGLSRPCDGSRSELPFSPQSDVWEKIAAEGESCTRGKCPHYKECYFFKARKEAEDASILVVNHHLLFADLSLRKAMNNYDDPCILPSYTRLTLDEAHHVEEVARAHFASKTSKRGLARQLNRLLVDKGGGKVRALHQRILECYPLRTRPEEISALLTYLELDFPREKESLIHLAEQVFQRGAHFLSLFSQEEKLRLRDLHLAHPFWVEECQPKIKELVDQGRRTLASFLAKRLCIEKDEKLKAKCEGLTADIEGISLRLEEHFATLLEFAFTPLTPAKVRWIELSSSNVQFITADVDVSAFLTDYLFKPIQSVVLCSATLTAHRNFTFIKGAMGIQEAIEKVYDSPFNYEVQTNLFIPDDMPHPDEANFVDEAVERIYESVLASQGHAFVLFTSYAALKACSMRLHRRFEALNYPLFCQGEGSTKQMLARFRETKNAILFGTDSFWEGIDVVGDALKCVIITKLPFKVPNDPLFQARSEMITKAGGSPFFDYSLPSAIMKFKQGFGRLIRSKHDRGCVVCLDNRLTKKGYGKHFLKSLPPCPCFVETKEAMGKKMKEFYEKRS